MYCKATWKYLKQIYTEPKQKRPVLKWILFALKQISKTRFRYV